MAGSISLRHFNSKDLVMNCDSKTLIKIAVGLGIALAAVYVVLPTSHAFIRRAPFLLFLVCPIAMIFMMKSMNCTTGEERAKDVKGKAANSPLDEPRSDKT
ncbi:DUF2933 domain-containing protein [Variovorax durovernensis]